jgi:hypothetical protein
MGTVSFVLADALPADARQAAGRACLAGGYDLAPVPTKVQVENDRLVLRKEPAESGVVLVDWPVATVGPVTCSSATLRDRVEPYHLVVELARGRVNQLRLRVTEWSALGLEVPAEDQAELADLTRRFGKLTLSPTDADALALGDEILTRSYRLGDRLARLVADLLVRNRAANATVPPPGISCRLARRPSREDEARFLETFTAVRLVPDWSLIEPTESGYDWQPFEDVLRWAEGVGLEVSVGPLVDLTNGPFPGWLRQWDGDMPSLATFMCDFAETLIRRYQNRVRTWQVFAGFNHADALGLGEDDRLRLAARLLEATRQTDPAAEWVVGIAQPWGDYLCSEDYTYSPLVFADTLLRAGFRFAAVELEVFTGAGGRASRPRDPLDTFRMLELFGVLGMPLEVSVGCPLHPATAVYPQGWADIALTLTAAMPHVRRVGWEAWDEGPTNRVPGCGLAAADGSSVLARLTGLRPAATL